jgi:hypothetical protein
LPKSDIEELPTDAYLMQFFGNVLLGEGNDLKNRRLHIHRNERRQDFSDLGISG